MSAKPLLAERINLRPSLAADEEFLLKAYASTRQAEMALVPWSQSQIDSFIRMQYKAQQSYYLDHYQTAEYQIVQYGSVDIGRLIVDRQPDKILLMDITLVPEYRNLGIGTSLIKELMVEAEQSFKPIRLHVETFNPALHLYERMGFKVINEMGIYFEMEWNPETVKRQVQEGDTTLHTDMLLDKGRD